MKYLETTLTPDVLDVLMKMSVDWASEKSCRGYHANTESDIQGNRIFLAVDGDVPVGYLFGQVTLAKRSSTVMEENTPYFEVEELYIVPGWRSKGVGGALFRYAENQVKQDAEYILLSTATQNWRAILHFYIEELGMEFWSARLFKKISEDNGKPPQEALRR